MSSEQTTAKGIRLPDRVWKAIDEQAAQSLMKRNEFLCRRLTFLFGVAENVSKIDENVPNGREMNDRGPVEELPDD